MKTQLRISLAVLLAGIMSLFGVASAVAAGSDGGSKSCQSSEDVVNRGDSGPASQYHYQSIASGSSRSTTHPYKGYRHVDYSNWGYSSVSSWYVQVGYDYILYKETTYAYCVN